MMRGKCVLVAFIVIFANAESNIFAESSADVKLDSTTQKIAESSVKSSVESGNFAESTHTAPPPIEVCRI